MTRSQDSAVQRAGVQTCIDACLACLSACEHCASACLAENDVKMMAECVRRDHDCADVCALTARLLMRGSGFSSAALCADACARCAEECAQHDHAHCQRCAAACRECEVACRALAA